MLQVLYSSHSGVPRFGHLAPLRLAQARGGQTKDLHGSILSAQVLRQISTGMLGVEVEHLTWQPPLQLKAAGQLESKSARRTHKHRMSTLWT